MKLPGMSMRLKILLGMLLVVGTVVGVITFTMAGLFRSDKKLYVSDLVSTMAMNAIHEAEVVAASYRDRLQNLATIADASNVPVDAKLGMLKPLLNRFRGLVAIRFSEAGREPLVLHDDVTLTKANLTRQQLAPAFAVPADTAQLMTSDGVRISKAVLEGTLPLLSATVVRQREDGRPPMVITALVRLDDFQRIALRSQSSGIFVMDGGQRLLAGPEGKAAPAANFPDAGPLSMVVAREYAAADGQKIGAIARAGIGGLSAVAELPMSVTFVASRLLLQRMLVVAFALLVLAAVVATLWARRITRSITGLSKAAQEVGRGRFDVNVQIQSRDEMGTLALSFNQMATELEKRELALKTAQAALIQSEKMAAFGQLGAGIAHEVKNPLAGIQGIVQLALRKAEASHPLHEPLVTIEKETRRCRTIIDNLLKFSRQEKIPQQPTDIGAVIADSVAIMNHPLALHEVTLEHEIEPDLPQVVASPNQIQQVLMNLILNADQAFEGEPGVVRVTAARTAEGGVELKVHDNGPGIPPDLINRIFEPFFTTKPAGEGTGLGLSVSFGIIKDHRGRIEVECPPGAGTTFTITLPAPDALARAA